MAFSIMADETADISGKEQMSLGVRYFDMSVMSYKGKIFRVYRVKRTQC